MKRYTVRTELLEIDGDEETVLAVTETEEQMLYDKAAEDFEITTGEDVDDCAPDGESEEELEDAALAEEEN